MAVAQVAHVTWDASRWTLGQMPHVLTMSLLKLNTIVHEAGRKLPLFLY